MPFGGGRTLAVNVSGLIWDANLIVPAGNTITVDHISETTGGHGIVTNQRLAPAAGITVAAGQTVLVDHIGETTGAHGIVTDNSLHPAAGVLVDHVGELTGAHNIVLDNIETGRQQGIGNSATGAVLANSFAGGTSAGVACVGFVIRRAGTYRCWVFNEIVYAAGGRVSVYKNAGLLFQSTAANAAQTNEDCGDRVFAAGDIIVAYSSAAVAGQLIIISLCNADGMWL
jgi:hypothetical protein